MKNTSQKDSLIIISTHVPDIYPHILRTGRKNGSRYLFHFPLFMLLYSAILNAKSNKEKKRWQAEYNRIVDELITDLKKSNAKLLLTAKDVLDDRVHAYLKQRYKKLDQIEARSSKLEVWIRKYQPGSDQKEADSN